MRDIKIEAQPDDDTCGATALHAVYRHFGDAMALPQVIDEVHHMEEGGTLAVLLGIHALLRGYRARLYSYNLSVFDPSWDGLSPEDLRKKLIAQTRIKDGKKLHAACLAYARFLKEGGEIRFDDPTPDLLRSYFDADLPVLAGLSATYLYRSKREYTGAKGKSLYHDLRGKPMGHFVVLGGMVGKRILVADPYHDNPMAEGRTYDVPAARLINSIFMGIVTYDANMLVLSPNPVHRMRKIIVVHDPKAFKLGVPNVEVVSSKDYLTDPRFAQLKNTRIFNLARSFVYQSRGYYVSLLAEARGHKVIPSAKTILDLKNPSIVKVLSRDLDEVIQHSLNHKEKHDFTLSMYFGRNVNPRYDKLAHELYKVFEAPLLRARFVKGEKWELRSVRPVPYTDIEEEHIPILKEFAAGYFGKKRYDTAREDRSSYDLAILVNPEDKAAPSNKRAIVKFRQAAEEMGFRVDIIGPDGIDRISEYDALLIRENTHVNNHTYRMARKAEQEGLAVMDAPDAILKCNNKVYLAEVMEAHHVPTPRTMIVHSENRHEVAKRLGFPVVLKLPDSTFSIGVVKAKNPEELEARLDEILAGSDLAVAQEYMPSDFDWRVGVLDGKPLYACKYYMAQGHWQIYNWGSATKDGETGNFDTVKVDHCSKHVMDAALKAVRAMVGENGLFGVDVKEHEGKAYVIEVNECPNIDHGIEDVELGDEIYRRIIGSLKKTIEKKIGLPQTPKGTIAPAKP